MYSTPSPFLSKYTGLVFCRFGPRFPSITSAYDRELRKLAAETGKELGMEDFIQTGVYFYLSGPSYETAAECKMIRSWGGDSVGMSTAPEVVVARHCGMKILGTLLVYYVCEWIDLLNSRDCYENLWLGGNNYTWEFNLCKKISFILFLWLFSSAIKTTIQYLIAWVLINNNASYIQ